MAELKIQLSGDDLRKLLSDQDAKISIAHVVFAVGKDYMKEVDTLVINVAPNVSLQAQKYWLEEAEKAKKGASETPPQT